MSRDPAHCLKGFITGSLPPRRVNYCALGDELSKMKIIESTDAALAHVRARTAKSVLVPTMGALHRGHLELIRVARQHAGNDGEVAVSIFVNPLQFAPGGDYEKYPRPEMDDEEFCRRAGVDILFRPTPTEMRWPPRNRPDTTRDVRSSRC